MLIVVAVFWGHNCGIAVFGVVTGRRVVIGKSFLLAFLALIVALPAKGWADGGAQESETGLIYYGGGDLDFLDLWAPGNADTALEEAFNVQPPQAGDIQVGLGWSPDISTIETNSSRQLGRNLVGSVIERVGVRTDLTAHIYGRDADGAPSTAWRVSGSLGYTSLSLVSSDLDPTGQTGYDPGLLWDVGVGWSSGSFSLSAGYQSATHFAEGEGADKAVLSLGADYDLFPGLSFYGEFSMIDDPLEYGGERLGTVLIVGTGLSF